VSADHPDTRSFRGLVTVLRGDVVTL